MPETPLRPVTPERPQPVEAAPEHREQNLDTARPEQTPVQAEQPKEQPSATPVAPVKPIEPTATSAPMAKQVEDVMSEGLGETYQAMDPVTQQRFKAAGEQTAKTISALLQQTKVQSKKILELIVGWLRIIPGINKFFLEQEAKIKTDKILAMRQPHDQ